jgi:CheY-like chemotaxis protein
MPPRYQLTDAGRNAWESQDTAVPADYRLILWLLDFHGNDYAASAFRRFPEQLLGAWLGEMEELGLIERATSGPKYAPERPAEPVADEVSAAEMLSRGGAYIAEHRLRSRMPPRKPRARIVVLIVEDDADQLALADLRVSMAGYKVRVANSVNGFLQAIVDEGAPDLLLLDVMLPDGDGFDVLARMRRHPALGSLPIILLTARSDAGDIGRGLVLGADGYVTKPYTKNLLVDVIRRALKHE